MAKKLKIGDYVRITDIAFNFYYLAEIAIEDIDGDFWVTSDENFDNWFFLGKSFIDKKVKDRWETEEFLSDLNPEKYYMCITDFEFEILPRVKGTELSRFIHENNIFKEEDGYLWLKS